MKWFQTIVKHEEMVGGGETSHNDPILNRLCSLAEYRDNFKQNQAMQWWDR